MKRAGIKRRPLADTVLATLEPEAAAYREADGNGLYFRVKPNGTKSWELRYKKPDGKWSWHGLGGYPDLSGSRAREKAGEARKLISDGVDPVAHKTAARMAEAIAAANTFRAAAEEWYAAKEADGKAESTLWRIRLYLDKDILPALGDKPLSEITRTDCAQLQATIEGRGAHNISAKARGWVNQIFGRAIGRGLCENNPASNLVDIAASAPKSKQHPHLLEPELPAFLHSLRATTSRLPARTATWMCLWTASRPGMVRWAEWTEIDFEQALWTIPAAKMKARRDHVVPLPRQLLDALHELQRMTGRSRYLFPGIGPKKPVMSENTINLTLSKVGYRGKLVGHGSRHTASTLLREHSWLKEHVEAQLAHKEAGVSGIYNQAQYLPQRRAMMQWYADYLDCLANGMTPVLRAEFDRQVNVIEDNVVEIRRA